jgi:predicted RNase H-like HicB family nuclease
MLVQAKDVKEAFDNITQAMDEHNRLSKNSGESNRHLYSIKIENTSLRNSRLYL